MITKTSCQHCGIHIEFEAEDAGETVPCPSCGQLTRLVLPSSKPAAPKQKNKHTTLFVVVGFIFVVVAIGSVAFIGKGISSKPSASNPDENLREVKGAMGWNLGDVLPTNFQVKTDDDTFGITYDFNPPADMEDAGRFMCYLILTEDRRIAVISISASGTDNFSKDTLQKVLKEKYGFRESLNLPFGGMVEYYFGQTNRQAILQTSGLNSMIELEYRDEQLYELAKQQQATRKAAAKEQIENELKPKL